MSTSNVSKVLSTLMFNCCRVSKSSVNARKSSFLVIFTNLTETKLNLVNTCWPNVDPTSHSSKSTCSDLSKTVSNVFIRCAVHFLHKFQYCHKITKKILWGRYFRVCLSTKMSKNVFFSCFPDHPRSWCALSTCSCYIIFDSVKCILFEKTFWHVNIKSTNVD